MTNTLGIMLGILSNYPWTRLSVRIIAEIKRQFFHMVMHVFDNSNLSKGFLQSTPGTWSQTHAYDYMETRIYMETRLYDYRVYAHLENLDSLELSANFEEIQKLRQYSGNFVRNFDISPEIFILKLILYFRTDILPRRSGLSGF